MEYELPKCVYVKLNRKYKYNELMDFMESYFGKVKKIDLIKYDDEENYYAYVYFLSLYNNWHTRTLHKYSMKYGNWFFEGLTIYPKYNDLQEIQPLQSNQSNHILENKIGAMERKMEMMGILIEKQQKKIELLQDEINGLRSILSLSSYPK